MVCLDTDILVGLLRGEKDAVEKIRKYEREEATISTTPISACELFKGAFRSSSPEKNVKLVEKMLKNIHLLEFDLKSSKAGGAIIERLREKGETIGEIDMIIAGIVLAHNETLVTRNTKHFGKIKELRLEEW